MLSTENIERGSFCLPQKCAPPFLNAIVVREGDLSLAFLGAGASFAIQGSDEARVHWAGRIVPDLAPLGSK